MMTAICLRRRKTEQLDGAPLITLPERQVNVDLHEFTTAEREFYEALEKQTQLEFNRYLRAGTVMENYTNILLLLLRLRQAACHPTLVAQYFRTSEAVLEEDEKKVKRLLNTMRPEVKNRLLSEDNLNSQECAICFDA
jgi:SNF2 family DNA or RNA helicase